MPPMPSLFSPYFRNNIVIPKIADPLIHLLLTVFSSSFKTSFSLPHQENEVTRLDTKGKLIIASY